MNITIGGKTKEVTDEQMKKIEKLLETKLRTPNNISFYAGDGEGKVYGLFFNNNQQVLDYNAPRKQWTVLATKTSVRRGNRKLVRTLQVDLLPGNVVLRMDDLGGDFGELECYGIVLNEKEVIYVTSLGGLHIDNDYYSYWWRVV